MIHFKMYYALLFLIFLYHANSYINPTQRVFDSPDPGVMRDQDEIYYAVTTGGVDQKKFPIWQSKDLTSWLLAGYVFLNPPSWTDGGDFWAPQIHKVNTTYNLYYTARTKSHKLCIGMAYSQSPLGPYTDLGAPLMQQDDLGIIDATYYKDTNNKSYLIYKTDGNAVGKPTQIYAVQLSADGKKVIGSRVFLLRNSLPFQGGIIEAPWIIYERQFYFMFYSSCGYNNKCYSVSVARSQNLLGPYQKFNSTILYTRNLEDQNSLEGPGHCSVIKGLNGNWAMVYHAWPHNGINTKRLMMLDKVQWLSNNWPYIGSPSETQQPIP